eukprot:scaffold125163_cov15-Tisochrysis_lutea.AAC.1
MTVYVACTPNPTKDLLKTDTLPFPSRLLKPGAATSIMTTMQSKVIDKEETFPFVAEHLRQQILGMAATLHNALEKAGDTVPAAHAMLQAKAAMAGQGQADACTGK